MPQVTSTGRLELRLDRGEAWLDGQRIAIGGRAFDLLASLVAAGGATVSKADLMDSAWPDRAVVENNLNTQIKALRQALGDAAILTVPGRGYRLGPGLQTAAPVSSLPDGLPTLAVLPFANLSGDPDLSHPAEGIADDILTALSAFRDVLVIARSSSFAFRNAPRDLREIGQRLGASYLLEGSWRQAADRTRLTATLTETAGGTQIWAGRFDGTPGDIFDLQDRITAQVVAAIGPAIRQTEIVRASRKPPENLVAHDLLLRAIPRLYAMTPRDNDAALKLLDWALEEQPAFPAALAHAAWALEQRLSRGWPNTGPGDRSRAVALARDALVTGGEDAHIICLAGFVLCTVGQDDALGLAALRRALELNPLSAFVCNFTGTAELFAGDLNEATRHLSFALRLSPADPAGFLLMTALACAKVLSGQPEEALDLCVQSATRNPGWDFNWWVSAAAAGMTGDRERARDCLAHLSPDGLPPFPSFRIFHDEARRQTFLGHLARTGLWPQEG